ncbi:MAG: ATP-binding protein, partial [Anaeroplasmataceae bacterium]|nr:ATP-binding protein [Anaeroplasmataceae bacterium]
MRKVNIEANEKEALAFVEELKKDPLLEGYDITTWNANDFALYAEEQRNCSKCKGLASCKNTNQGYMLKPEDNNFVLVPCKFKKEASKKETENQKIKTLFISKSILQADLKDFDASTPNRKKIYEYIIKFIHNLQNKTFTKGLYIYGNFATGKTFILGCIANELARNGIESLIIYFPDLVVELKNSIGSSRLEELINYLKSVDVLLLDDLGSENMTPWLRDEVLGPVLNYRLMEEKPVFISSNLNPKTDELIEHLSTSKASSD